MPEGPTDAAQVYEQLFVAAEFAEWAPRLLARCGLQTGQRLLDVACGTGVLARAARRHVGAQGRVVGVDIDPGMLAVAARVAPDLGFVRASAAQLPFEDASFDALTIQFGLMFFPDRTAALREALRVLSPGGRLVVSTWDSLARTPAYATLVQLLEREAGQAAEALRTPFSLGEPELLSQLFAEAGMPSIVVTRHVGEARFPDVQTLLAAELDGWLPMLGITLDGAQRARLETQLGQTLARYIDADGTLRFASPAYLVTVRRP